MNLRNLDLNLLPSLQALLDEKSVSRAAVRMRMSQPALSAALARLRRHFNDELLVRHGNSYELSPLAVHLREKTWAAVSSVERVFSSQPEFDAASSNREFTIRGLDYSFAVFGSALSMVISKVAPDVRLRFENAGRETVDNAPESLRECDGIIIPHGFLRLDTHLDLYQDRWVCIVDSENDRIGDQLTMHDLAELPWVFTLMESSAFTPAARQMQMQGIEPRVEAVTPNFMALPELIEFTPRIGLIQERLARRITQGRHLRLVDPPFETVPVKEAFWWNEIYTKDPEHQWLRSMMSETGRQLAVDSPS
ncbi:LysR family transcriptional regulator [Subtercola sp. YIM 133946]|uniref:LysR family transcriptional regulator n=1 Tax=Subtercola sp. YIM 133946 TaxID=3118909 RepID=UPI002F9283E2